MTKKKRAERRKQIIWGAVGVVVIILLAVVAGYSTELRTQVTSFPASLRTPSVSPITYADLVRFTLECSQQAYDPQAFDCTGFSKLLDDWCRENKGQCLTASIYCSYYGDDQSPHGINYVKISRDGEEQWCLVDAGVGFIDCDSSINPGTLSEPDSAPNPATMSSICTLMTQNHEARPNGEDKCYCQQIGLTDVPAQNWGLAESCAEAFDQHVTSDGYGDLTQKEVGQQCLKCCSFGIPYREQSGAWAAACVDACHDTFPALNISPDVCAADKGSTSQLACHQCCDRQVGSAETGSEQWLTECKVSCNRAHPLATTGFLSPLQSTLKNIFP